MMYSPEFEYAVGLKKQGDNKIKLVASALEEYGLVRDMKGSNPSNITALRNLSKACAWWLFDKKKKIAEKSATKTQGRAVEVRTLLTAALTELSKLSPEEGQYASQKCAAIGGGAVVALKETSFAGRVTNVSFSAKPEETKALAPGYALERKDYLAKKERSNPVAGSAVSYAMEHTAGVKEKFSKKDWDTLSYADYGAIAKLLGQGPTDPAYAVGYLKRAERLACLISYCNSVLTYTNGKGDLKALMGYNGNLLKYGAMYAMDRYGNLYAEDQTNGKLRKKTGFFNHSSFCSGSSVICAGVLAVDKKGALVYIDSVSGHYKPSLQDLIRALRVLSSAGIDLKNVRATDFAGKDYFAASLTTGAPVAWDPALNVKLGLADLIRG